MFPRVPRLGLKFQPTFSIFPARPSARWHGNRAEDFYERRSDSTLSSQRANADGPDDHLLRGPVGPGGGRARPAVTSPSDLDGCRDKAEPDGVRRRCASGTWQLLDCVVWRHDCSSQRPGRPAVGGDLRSVFVSLAGGRSRRNVLFSWLIQICRPSRTHRPVDFRLSWKSFGFQRPG